ncbi:unnamed protein product, partial [Amoebophrya sp. A25]
PDPHLSHTFITSPFVQDAPQWEKSVWFDRFSQGFRIPALTAVQVDEEIRAGREAASVKSESRTSRGRSSSTPRPDRNKYAPMRDS